MRAPHFKSLTPRLGLVIMLTLGLTLWRPAGPALATPEPGTAPVITLSTTLDPRTGALSLHTTHPNEGQWGVALVADGQADVAADGAGQWSGSPFWSGSTPVRQIGQTPQLVTGGIDGESYTLFIQHFSATNLTSNVLKIENYVEDTQAPVVEISQFTTQGTQASIQINTTEGDGRLYLVITDTASPVSKAQLRDGLDAINMPAVYARKVEVSNTQGLTLTLSNLTPDVPYYASTYQVDDHGLESEIIAQASQPSAPVFVEDFSGYADGDRLIDSPDWYEFRNAFGGDLDHVTTAGSVTTLPLPTTEERILIASTATPAIDRFVEVTLDKVPTTSTNRFELIVAAVDTDNYYYAHILKNRLRIYQRANAIVAPGKFTDVTPFVTGDVLRFEKRGGDLIFLINTIEVDRVSITTPLAAAGGVGFGNYHNFGQGQTSISSIRYGDLF